MRIGLTYDLKEAVPQAPNSPDDASEEYDSQTTVDILAAALSEKGHTVLPLGGGEDFLLKILQNKTDIDFVFNISEGRGSYKGREAQVPSVLEMLNIPYSGSDPQCLTVCLDKPLTKTIIKTFGAATPNWVTVSEEHELQQINWSTIGFPSIIKPAFEGSSKGIHLTSLVHNSQQAQQEAARLIKNYQQPVMIEEFIEGDEITVGVTGNQAPEITGIMRVLPKKRQANFVYSVEVKRDYVNLVDYECPARLPAQVLTNITETTRKIFVNLGCRDFARLDYRIAADGTPYFIEINPLPGLGTYSDLIIMAGMMGCGHKELIQKVLDAALRRYSLCQEK